MSARAPRAAAAAIAASIASPTPRSLGSTSTPGTPVLAECPSNDDERERRQRRRSRAVDSSLQGLGSPAPRPEGWQAPLPQWSNAQISEHYSTCIKLCTENKITTKNAFGLHLIDYMTEILKQKNSEVTNFKVAAGTLDASAKIYAVRVDSVHADTYRVLGNLGKEPPGPARDPQRPQPGSSPAPEAKVRRKPGRSFRTIESNLSNINAPEGSRGCQVDPMFRRAVSSFDECDSSGVFLSGLRSQSCQSLLEFPSGIIPLPSGESPALPSAQPLPLPRARALLSQCLEKRRICSSLAGFQFTNWDEESHNESVSALLEKFGKSEKFDPNAELEDEEGEACAAPSEFQAEFQLGSPGSEAGETCGDFPENLGAFGSLGSSQRSGRAALGEGDIGTMSLHLSMNPGEYSYFSPRTLSMWAGPEHWRFRPRPRPDPSSERESRTRNPRKVFQLDFEEDVDLEPHFRKTKASTTLAKSILEFRNVRSSTLPADFHYEPQTLLQLFLKPLLQLSRSPDPVGSLDPEAGIGDYDYENPGDTCNFCPGLQDPDSDDDPDPAEFPGEFHPSAHPEAPEGTGSTGIDGIPNGIDGIPNGINGIDGISDGIGTGGDITTYGELNLLAEPHKPQRFPVPYARTAKRMDMRRLKRNMWELLTGTEQAQEGEEGSDTAVGEKVLSELTKELLHRLPPAMATNLSVPLAFVCLLHLANEKNLKLESSQDLSDVLVRAGESLE